MGRINKNLPTFGKVNKQLDELKVGDIIECGNLSKFFNLSSNAVAGRYISWRKDFERLGGGKYKKVMETTR